MAPFLGGQAPVFRWFFSLFFITVLCASCLTRPSPAGDMAADRDPLPAGELSLGVPVLFPSRIEQIQARLVYEPRFNRVYLEFPYQTVTYRQYWDQAAREKLVAAVEQYHLDFEAQNLPLRNRSKSRRAYGSFRTMTEWGTFSFMINSRGYPQIDLGYTFHKESPYFLVTQLEAKDVRVEGREIEHNSLRITLYFTRTLAAALAQQLREENLRSLLGAETPPAPGMVPDAY
jgi:hypothetical protein